jgi:SWI/SNF-related matrix-associated actin-dependent regulator 1 of chromatin subfamily A
MMFLEWICDKVCDLFSFDPPRLTFVEEPAKRQTRLEPVATEFVNLYYEPDPEPGVKIVEPRPFQRKGIRMISKFNGRALLGDEMGLGKTVQSLLWYYEHRDIATPAIVVCPANLKWNWEEEIKRHIGIKAEVCEKRKPNRERRQELKIGRLKHKILIINYDILEGWIPTLLRLKPKLLIVDEIHNCRNRKAKRTEMLKILSENIRYMIACSGTPFWNTPAELWPVLNMLNPDKWDSYPNFAWEYAYPKMARGRWTYTGGRNLKELNKELKQHVLIRRRKADVLDELPAKTRRVIPVDITDRREYEFAERDFLGWLRTQSKAKALRASKSMQMARLGYLKRLAARLKMPSIISRIEDFLEESDQKLLVFGIHKKILGPLKEHFSDQCVLVNGDTPKPARKEAVKLFMTKSKYRLFFGNIDTAGVGLNLTCTNYGHLIELPWTPAQCDQVESRNHRIGQDQKVLWDYPVARGTVEEDLCELIQRKQSYHDEVIDGFDVEESIDIYDQLSQMIQLRRKKNKR